MPTGVYTRGPAHLAILRKNAEHSRSFIDYSGPRKPLTEDHKKSISIAHRGRKPSREQRYSMSVAAKKRFENPEERRKLSEMWSGDKSPFWRGGVTAETIKIKSSLEYTLWRLAVLKRDRYTCTLCGDKNRKGRGSRIVLNVDHIKPFALHPELRFSLENGRVLCVTCHRKTDTYGYKTARLQKVKK